MKKPEKQGENPRRGAAVLCRVLAQFPFFPCRRKGLRGLQIVTCDDAAELALAGHAYIFAHPGSGFASGPSAQVGADRPTGIPGLIQRRVSGPRPVRLARLGSHGLRPSTGRSAHRSAAASRRLRTRAGSAAVAFAPPKSPAPPAHRRTVSCRIVWPFGRSRPVFAARTCASEFCYGSYCTLGRGEFRNGVRARVKSRAVIPKLTGVVITGPDFGPA
jgi:hypothetical protein